MFKPRVTHTIEPDGTVRTTLDVGRISEDVADRMRRSVQEHVLNMLMYGTADPWARKAERVQEPCPVQLPPPATTTTRGDTQ